MKPSFAVVPGLKSPFVLAVVGDLLAAVELQLYQGVILAVVPSYDPYFALVIADEMCLAETNNSQLHQGVLTPWLHVQLCLNKTHHLQLHLQLLT